MPVEILSPASREEWLALRGKTIGASESAALFGVHPFTTVYELHHLKAGTITADPSETGPMRRGRHLESVAVEFLREERRDWTVTANPMPGGRFYRDLAAGLSATPDAFAVDPARDGIGIVQIKSVEPSVYRTRWKAEDGSVEPPLYVAVQAIQEAMLTGAAWAVVCPLVIGFAIEMPVLEVPLHAGFVDTLLAKAAAFWRQVQDGTAPDPDCERDGAAIAKLYRQDNGMELDLRSDNHLPELLGQRERLKADIKVASEAVEAIDAEFKHRIGSHESAVLAGGQRATWKLQHRKGFTVEPSSFRVLRYSKAR